MSHVPSLLSLDNITQSKRSRIENIIDYGLHSYVLSITSKINETACLGTRGRKTGEGGLVNVRLLFRVISKAWMLVLLQTSSLC